jgi:hypothetical protein
MIYGWCLEVPREVVTEILLKRIKERGWILAEPGQGLASVMVVGPKK